MTGVQTLSGTTTGLAADYRAGCDMVDPARNRPDAVYALTLTQPRMVTLTLHGGAGNPNFDTSLYVRTTCDMPSSEFVCSDDNDAVANHGSLIARVLPPGTYFVFVDGSEDMTSGTTQQGAYDLEVRLGAPVTDTGSVTTTPGVTCPAVPTGATQVRFGVEFDDAQSGALAIGFSMRMLGATYDHFAVDINGYAQLLQGDSTISVSGSVMAENLPIPTASQPNALVAPFWDDLTLYSARIDTWLDGTSDLTRHIRWSNMRRYNASGYDLTFEARLYQSGRVELHYCTLGGSSNRAHGDSATIGLESLAGDTGIPLGFNTRILTDNTVIRIDLR